jgi:hypothetical protein
MIAAMLYNVDEDIKTLRAQQDQLLFFQEQLEHAETKEEL